MSGILDLAKLRQMACNETSRFESIACPGLDGGDHNNACTVAMDTARKAWHSANRPENDPAVPMLLWCPECVTRHVDVGEFATKLHHTHACQECGNVWRPAIVSTVGVQFLPGFKNE